MTTAPDPAELAREHSVGERGDLRVIYTDGGGAATPSMQRDLGDQVWAFVGPIGKHTSHPELQDAIALVAMAFNRRHGRLSEEKHKELLRDRYGRGAELLREALLEQLASTTPPPDDEVDALLERMDNDRYNIASVDPDDAEKAINLIRSYRARLASTMSAEEVRMRVAQAMEEKLGEADIFKDDEECYPDRFTDQNTNCGGGAGTVIVDGCINLLEMADAAIRAMKVMK